MSECLPRHDIVSRCRLLVAIPYVAHGIKGMSIRFLDLLDNFGLFHDDFETGSSSHWLPAPAAVVGDLTQLWHDLDDIDPDPGQQNDSWQVAFIDDGLVVPGTGGSPCVNWCYGPDGWVFNVDAGLQGHGVGALADIIRAFRNSHARCQVVAVAGLLGGRDD